LPLSLVHVDAVHSSLKVPQKEKLISISVFGELPFVPVPGLLVSHLSPGSLFSFYPVTGKSFFPSFGLSSPFFIIIS